MGRPFQSRPLKSTSSQYQININCIICIQTIQSIFYVLHVAQRQKLYVLFQIHSKFCSKVSVRSLQMSRNAKKYLSKGLFVS